MTTQTFSGDFLVSLPFPLQPPALWPAPSRWQQRRWNPGSLLPGGLHPSGTDAPLPLRPPPPRACEINSGKQGSRWPLEPTHSALWAHPLAFPEAMNQMQSRMTHQHQF